MTRKQPNYLNSSGLIAMNNPIMSPITTPMIVRAVSIFFSLVVISTSHRHGKPYHRYRFAIGHHLGRGIRGTVVGRKLATANGPSGIRTQDLRIMGRCQGSESYSTL